jgi:hypothetical protein
VVVVLPNLQLKFDLFFPERQRLKILVYRGVFRNQLIDLNHHCQNQKSYLLLCFQQFKNLPNTRASGRVLFQHPFDDIPYKDTVTLRDWSLFLIHDFEKYFLNIRLTPLIRKYNYL